MTAHSVFCHECQQPIDWMRVSDAARYLEVSGQRVRQLVKQNRFPGQYKFDPHGGTPPYWRIPVASLVAYKIAKEAG